MTTRLLLVRHGQTAYNAEVRFMGQLDIPLDEVGRLQAQAVAKRLSTERPAAIYCSGLSRAVDTANAIRSAIGSHPELRIDGRLTEGHFGAWQGQAYDSLRVQDAGRLAQWEADRLHFAPPEGETLPQIAERVQAAYADICAENRDQTAIIVAHGGSLQVLIILALGLPLDTYWKIWVSNASVSELHIDERGPVLQLLNDTSHLIGHT
jgi:broad specificity phosphatase PhoE